MAVELKKALKRRVAGRTGLAVVDVSELAAESGLPEGFVLNATESNLLQMMMYKRQEELTVNLKGDLRRRNYSTGDVGDIRAPHVVRPCDRHIAQQVGGALSVTGESFSSD